MIMISKTLTAACAIAALLTASTAFAADAGPKLVSAKEALKIAQMSRARTHLVNGRENHDATTTALIAGAVAVVGVGIAAAAGAFHSSN
jgi:hypothetical protein